MARTVALVAALALALAVASPAGAAAPNYILVSGKALDRPILLANWSENLVLLTSLVAAPRAGASVVRKLAARPRLDLAEFWAWRGRPRPTRPSQASQHGSFYPAHGKQPAVFELTVGGVTAPRVAPARTLRILAAHGVPTRL